MEGFVQKFQAFKIQLVEIKKATNNFDDENNYIGGGGFGKVYKGEVSHSKGRSMAAVKRLDRRHGQGEAEFMKEINTLTRYKHENLISLLGFHYQGDEMIIVYELASRGSLDKYLKSPELTWSKRIKICLDAAKGLRHLHDPKDTHQRLIHCDVKGGNILLDDQWNAKIADFGFSTMGPANELYSTVINLAAGTPGYIDPVYRMTNTLTKESDVYSFGVVLFEVLFGRFCYTVDNNGRLEILVPTWKKCYEEKKLNGIIFKDPAIQPLEQSALEIFSDIAYQCLKEARKDRPDMADVVIELECALKRQVLLASQEFKVGWNKQHSYYKAISKSAKPPLNYKSEVELKNLLSKGVLLKEGKTWFLLNKKGEHCEMISIAECLMSRFRPNDDSRFLVGTYHSDNGIFKARVQTQFLSPGITYTVNLVFKFDYPKNLRNAHHIGLRYKLKGETESLISYLAYEREDGWWMCELYQFTSNQRAMYLEILFDGFENFITVEVEGIEFWPLEKVDEKQDPDSGANWEETLPTDYQDIMTRSENCVQWTTKEEAYSIMSKGFFINDGKWGGSIWFSLGKNGKKCLMLSAKYVWPMEKGVLSLPGSRFGKALHCDTWTIHINRDIESQLVSSETTYAAYLVYKLPEDQSGYKAPMEVRVRVVDGRLTSYDYWHVYLLSPQTPIVRPQPHQNTHSPVNRQKIKSLPQQREDGWREVQIWEFQPVMTTEMIRAHLTFEMCGERKKFRGLIIEGIEFRPI